MGYTVAIVGATGAVGTQMIRQLEQSNLPIEQVKLLSSSRSAGKILLLKMRLYVLKRQQKNHFTMLILPCFQLVDLFQQSSLLMQ